MLKINYQKERLYMISDYTIFISTKFINIQRLRMSKY